MALRRSLGSAQQVRLRILLGTALLALLVVTVLTVQYLSDPADWTASRDSVLAGPVESAAEKNFRNLDSPPAVEQRSRIVDTPLFAHQAARNEMLAKSMGAVDELLLRPENSLSETPDKTRPTGSPRNTDADIARSTVREKVTAANWDDTDSNKLQEPPHSQLLSVSGVAPGATGAPAGSDARESGKQAAAESHQSETHQTGSETKIRKKTDRRPVDDAGQPRFRKPAETADATVTDGTNILVERKRNNDVAAPEQQRLVSRRAENGPDAGASARTVTLAASLETAVPHPAPEVPEETLREFLRSYGNAFAAGDASALGRLFAPDGVDRQLRGREAISSYYHRLFRRTSSRMMRVIVDSVRSFEPDRYLIRGRYAATFDFSLQSSQNHAGPIEFLVQSTPDGLQIQRVTY
jgi:hypothetical protein